MIRFEQVSNSSEIPSMSILSARFRKIQSMLNKLCWWQNETEAFSAIKIKIFIWYGQFSELIWAFILTLTLICKFRKRASQNWMSYVDDKVKQRLFQQSRGHTLRLMIRYIASLRTFRDFFHVHFICKFQEVPIKTERVMKMTKSKRGIFSNQGEVTKIYYPVWPYLELAWVLSMSNLSASFRKI